MKKNYVKGKALGLMEGYNSFMYKDSVKRNEGIVARKTTIQNEMEKQQQEKAAEKAAMLIDLCKAYESKEGILRTLSANHRRQ